PPRGAPLALHDALPISIDVPHFAVEIGFACETLLERRATFAGTFGRLGVVEIGGGRVVLPARAMRERGEDIRPIAAARLDLHDRHAWRKTPECYRCPRMARRIARLLGSASPIAIHDLGDGLLRVAGRRCCRFGCGPCARRVGAEADDGYAQGS